MQDKKLDKEMEDTEVPRGHLVITSQGSITTEHFSKNGIPKQVHLVVKNLAFHVEVESSMVDLSKSNLAAKLLYDFDRDDDPKLDVAYVKNEPLEYKVNVFEGGSKALLELKIKVLTSQHEDMLFRIQIVAVDPLTSIIYETYSKPIKVISKMTQLKKAEANSSATANTPNAKRRVGSDSVMDTLVRLEQHITRQTEILTTMSRRIQTLEEISQHQMAEEVLKSSQISQLAVAEDGNELESSFRKFVNALGSLHPEEKQTKLTGLMASVPQTEADKLVDLLTVLGDHTPNKKRKS